MRERFQEALVFNNPEVLNKEVMDGEPFVEVLGSVREFSQKKRWFRDKKPIPDIG